MTVTMVGATALPAAADIDISAEVVDALHDLALPEQIVPAYKDIASASVEFNSDWIEFTMTTREPVPVEAPLPTLGRGHTIWSFVLIITDLSGQIDNGGYPSAPGNPNHGDFEYILAVRSDGEKYFGLLIDRTPRADGLDSIVAVVGEDLSNPLGYVEINPDETGNSGVRIVLNSDFVQPHPSFPGFVFGAVTGDESFKLPGTFEEPYAKAMGADGFHFQDAAFTFKPLPPTG